MAALGSWLDARAHGGRWLLRIEDVDGPRTAPGAQAEILRQLQALGLRHDGDVWLQSTRGAAYQAALDRLMREGLAYPCACTRQAIEARMGRGRPRRRTRAASASIRAPAVTDCPRGCGARAWRLRVGSDSRPVVVDWRDRRQGAQRQDVTHEVGDFVLRRADGPWAYQLAVVVDDAAQQVSDVVRGEDLGDNTARQIHLQRCLGLPTPRYLHLPLVRDTLGRKLSKSNGAAPLALDTEADARVALRDAARVPGLPDIQATTSAAFLHAATSAWKHAWPLAEPRQPDPQPSRSAAMLRPSFANWRHQGSSP